MHPPPNGSATYPPQPIPPREQPHPPSDDHHRPPRDQESADIENLMRSLMRCPLLNMEDRDKHQKMLDDTLKELEDLSRRELTPAWLRSDFHCDP